MNNGRTITAMLLILMLLTALVGCGQSEAAKAADAQIASIGTVDLYSEPAILAAEEAVNSLEQKDLDSLKNRETLSKARETFDELVDLDKIAKVEDSIKSIGTVDLNSEPAIKAARSAYNSLEDRLKDRVSSLNTLEQAESAYVTACDKAEAAKIEELISAIGEVTLARKDVVEKAISNAQKALDAAPESIQVFVSNAGEIQAARDQLFELEVEKVESAINDIGEVTLDSERLIKLAEIAYKYASPDVQAKISNYNKIEEARNQLWLLQAQHVDALIAEIGTVTLNSQEAINVAQTAYTELDPSAAVMVNGLQTLKDAQAEILTIWQKEADSLLSKMRSETDQVRGLAFYHSKNQPIYADTRSYALPYIGVNTQKKQVWLCFIMLYTGDNWVFFEKITFAIDDARKTKTYKYGDWVRDNANGSVWEYINTDSSSEYIDIFHTIADSQQTIIRFEGDVYYYDLTVSQKDKDTIREVFKAYEALVNAGYQAIG